jgi:chromosome segregation ATPase
VSALQLAESQEHVQQLQEQLEAAQQQVQQLEQRGSVLAAERDAAARNLLRAETELNDVGEYSTKMFRQVKQGADIMSWSAWLPAPVVLHNQTCLKLRNCV